MIASYLISYQRMKRWEQFEWVWYLNAANWELYFLFCSAELWGDHTTWSNIDFEKYFIIFTAAAAVGGIHPSYLHFAFRIWYPPTHPFSFKITNSNFPSNQAFIWSQVKYFVSIAISIFCANSLVTLSKILLLVFLFQLTRDNKNILEYKSLLKYYR